MVAKLIDPESNIQIKPSSPSNHSQSLNDRPGSPHSNAGTAKVKPSKRGSMK